MNRSGWLQGKGFTDVPEQLMKLPHDREYLKHLLRRAGSFPPVAPPKRHLGNLLPRPKTIVHRASTKASLPKAAVNPAAKIRLQVLTGRPALLVDGKI
ncbi:Uncharacterised protein [Mycobacterium tuberculosis]|nr:Uncharacterised protein [Mycobacterium tuberculosis]